MVGINAQLPINMQPQANIQKPVNQPVNQQSQAGIQLQQNAATPIAVPSQPIQPRRINFTPSNPGVINPPSGLSATPGNDKTLSVLNSSDNEQDPAALGLNNGAIQKNFSTAGEYVSKAGSSFKKFIVAAGAISVAALATYKRKAIAKWPVIKNFFNKVAEEIKPVTTIKDLVEYEKNVTQELLEGKKPKLIILDVLNLGAKNIKQALYLVKSIADKMSNFKPTPYIQIFTSVGADANEIINSLQKADTRSILQFYNTTRGLNDKLLKKIEHIRCEAAVHGRTLSDSNTVGINVKARQNVNTNSITGTLLLISRRFKDAIVRMLIGS